jgi:hypothetical protein
MADAPADLSFPHQLASQSWTLYGIGMFMIILRTYVFLVFTTLSLSNSNLRVVDLHDGAVSDLP